MAKEPVESYDDLIFQLGDLARETLANKASYPRSMERVFKAEEVVIARREELAELEAQMNQEDADYHAFLEAQAQEQQEQEAVTRQWQKAVDAIRGRTKDLRKKVASYRANLRYEKNNLKLAERRHHDLEMTQHHDQKKIEVSRNNLKRFRLALMRKERDLEELEAEFLSVLTPRPGQPGAAGILAHRRLLEMEDEAEDRKAEHEEKMAELDKLIAAKDVEVHAAEDYLDQALYLLGEECYSSRFSDPALAVFYPRLDKVAAT